MKLYYMIVLSMLVMLLSGCEGTSSNKPSLLVDLSVLAKALGRNEIINNQIASAEKQLNEQLNKIAVDLNKQIKTEKETLTSKSSDKEKARVNQFSKQAQQVMRNKKAEAQTKINTLKANLLSKFREEVKVAAEPIAEKNGAKMVMVIGADTLWFDPAVDITDEVIDKMRIQQ